MFLIVHKDRTQLSTSVDHKFLVHEIHFPGYNLEFNLIRQQNMCENTTRTIRRSTIYVRDFCFLCISFIFGSQ